MIFKTTKPKLKHYNIPPTDENHELLRKAKAAIAASHPDQALELLSTLKLKTLDIEITALSARLSDLERTQRFGTESYDTETREHNKINKSIIFLITALEKEIAQSFEFYDKIRAALKSRYETRLSQKLSNRQPVNLRLVPSTTGTTPQAANTFVQYSEGQIRGKLAEYYQDANGRLLLVGVPGAGKTTLLLQLELELLEQETTRIPVILNLARWSSTFPTLEAWIQEILPSEMGLTINKKMAGDLIAQNRLILLLDGLDEVKAEDRQVCLEAIGGYGEDFSRYFILSSRIDEYKAVAKDAPVNGQVEVGMLAYEQLIEQLEKADSNKGSQRLLAAIREDAILCKVAEIPFYFNTLQLLFARGKYLHEFNFSALDTENRKKEIERSFVFEMFQKFIAKDYDAQLANKYLGFFASIISKKNIIDFELINLQYTWYDLSVSEFIKTKYIEGIAKILGPSLVAGPLSGLLVGVISDLFFNVNDSVFLGLIGGIISGFFLGFIAGGVFGLISDFGLAGGLKQVFMWYLKGRKPEKNYYPIIKTRDMITWRWSDFRFNLSSIFKFIYNGFIIYGLIGGPFCVLLISASAKILPSYYSIYGQILVPFNNSLQQVNLILFGNQINSIFEYIFSCLILGFLIGSSIGTGFGLFAGIANGWYTYTDKNNANFIQINTPYQRFISSARSLYFSILQHRHLRHLLHKKGLLPKKLVPFLNDMVECNILETTGASWRFRHRILQDYFADQWVETDLEPEQK